jgi:hypothetical protein
MANTHDHDHENDASMACAMPITKERELPKEIEGTIRARLIRVSDKRWANGTEITYFYFTDGPYADQRNNIPFVEKGFKGWTDVGIGLKFTRVMDIKDSMIRIGFLQGDGAWSYVGRDNLNIRMSERTMNFGWDLRGDRRGDGVDTPLHEIGHMLGFPHEHQNPNAGIVWNEEAVLRAYARPPNNWDERTITYNILRKLDKDKVEGSDWDPDSIMHYGFGRGMIKSPEEYSRGLSPEDGLSQKDIGTVRKLYPPLSNNDDPTPLKNNQTANISDLSEGSEKTFLIEPTISGNYRMETIGAIDSLMVLSELLSSGSKRQIGANDDSGTGDNALIETNLQAGRKYLLTVRLIFKADPEADALVSLQEAVRGGSWCC